MPIEDLLGLLACIALLAAVFGATVAGILLSFRRSNVDEGIRFRDALARWLTAVMNVNRASVSLLESCRQLSREPKHSPAFSARVDEALRARTWWHDAVREVDLCESQLLIWSQDERSNAEFRTNSESGRSALATAIHGDSAKVDELIKAIQSSDADARRAVIAALTRNNRLPSLMAWITRRTR